jgi:hypothetical protein
VVFFNACLHGTCRIAAQTRSSVRRSLSCLLEYHPSLAIIVPFMNRLFSSLRKSLRRKRSVRTIMMHCEGEAKAEGIGSPRWAHSYQIQCHFSQFGVFKQSCHAQLSHSTKNEVLQIGVGVPIDHHNLNNSPLCVRENQCSGRD